MTEAIPVHRVGVIDVALDWQAEASPERAWNAFFNDPQAWWPKEFRALGADTRMRFAPTIGAQLIEENDEGATLAWYTVFALDPNKSVDLQGALASRYGGPATSLLHIEIAQGDGPGRCVVKMTDSLVGRLGPGTGKSVTDGWSAILGDGFVKSLAP